MEELEEVGGCMVLNLEASLGCSSPPTFTALGIWGLASLA
jgi:hypothetical protein